MAINVDSVETAKVYYQITALCGHRQATLALEEINNSSCSSNDNDNINSTDVIDYDDDNAGQVL